MWDSRAPEKQPSTLHCVRSWFLISGNVLPFLHHYWLDRSLGALMPPDPRSANGRTLTPSGLETFFCALGATGFSLPGKEGTHFLCHWHALA